MRLREADPDLRRFERDGVVACAVMAGGAFLVSWGRWDVAGGVLAGGALTGLSYAAIKGGIDALVRAARQVPGGADSAPPARRPSLLRAALTVVKFFTRYALLAVGAYVMLTCFHLHPAGLLVGALSPFVAALGQLVRMYRAPSGGEHLL